MLTHRNLLMASFAALLALGLAACGTGGNGPGPTTDDEDDQAMMPVTPEPDPEPTPLDVARTAAADAATAAGVAATAAGDAAAAAMTAAMGRAPIQTAANSSTHAYDAHTHAGLSRTAADNALTAATEAADATTLIDAIRAQLAAEAFQKSAEDHRDHVTGFHDDAVAAAAAEVFVGEDADGNATYTVGGTTINAAAAAHRVTENDQTTITGLIMTMNPMATGPGVLADDAQAGAVDDPDTDGDQSVNHVHQVAARTFAVGKVIDSADDTARLMLVTHYAGTKMVRVYSMETDTQTGTKAGYISIDVTATNDDTETNNVALRSEGMWYRAGAVTGTLDHNDEVGAETEAVEVFSFVDPNDDTNTKEYVVETTILTQAGTTMTTYTEVDVGAPFENSDDDLLVRAALPEATAYEHINFGVWTALGEAAKSGAQDITALGTGFVSSIGDGMTGDDMPNNGDATYTGNWVATVRAADVDGEGAIRMRDGAATLTADFGKGDITAMLMGLARLDGDITGNAFSGNKATVLAGEHGLNMAGEFEGDFAGGFFGSKAAEAGGVFNFSSEDKEDGEFAGAFGGDRDAN